MISLHIAIGLITLFAVAFVIFYSTKKPIETEDAALVDNSSVRPLVVLPVLALVTAPLVYTFWPSANKQADWLNVMEKTDQMTSTGSLNGLEFSIQDLILGLRTQAHENPERGDIWFELGGAYIRLQMEDAAVASWERAIRIEENPDWLVALAQILGTRTESVERKKAVNLLVRALKQSPEHQGALLTLGFTYFRDQQFEAAITAWEQLKQQKSLSPQSIRFIDEQIAQAKVQIQQAKNE